MRTFFKFPTTTFVVVFLFGAMFVLSSASWREWYIPTIMYPVLCIKEYCVRPLQNWLLWRKGVAELETRAQAMLQERNELLKELIRLKGTRDYILDCQEGIDFAQRYEPGSALTVQILLKQFSDQSHYYFIDAGENRGIKKDMVVLYDNCLVGRVSEVYAYYCKVMVITDKGSHVAARCVCTEACGIVSGANDSENMVMEFVNHLDAVQDGDTVLSHGEGLVFPRGFALGKVKSYQLEGVSYRLIIEPLIDLRTLSYCVILLRY